MSKLRSLVAIVDDEEPIRIALRRLLRSAGFDVETFSSGSEFLESLKARRPDCLILDLNMPHLDGFTVQSRLADTKFHLPVIVLTGHDTPEARERVMGAGATAYLRKPVDDQKLMNAIVQAVQSAPDSAPA